MNECKKYASVNVCAENKSNGYTDISDPKDWKVEQDASFFHYCENETIQGFEFTGFDWSVVPEGQTVVCDMSSNFCSRPIDWSKYGVVYAGA